MGKSASVGLWMRTFNHYKVDTWRHPVRRFSLCKAINLSPNSLSTAASNKPPHFLILIILFLKKINPQEIIVAEIASQSLFLRHKLWLSLSCFRSRLLTLLLLSSLLLCSLSFSLSFHHRSLRVYAYRICEIQFQYQLFRRRSIIAFNAMLSAHSPMNWVHAGSGKRSDQTEFSSAMPFAEGIFFLPISRALCFLNPCFRWKCYRRYCCEARGEEE